MNSSSFTSMNTSFDSSTNEQTGYINLEVLDPKDTNLLVNLFFDPPSKMIDYKFEMKLKRLIEAQGDREEICFENMEKGKEIIVRGKQRRMCEISFDGNFAPSFYFNNGGLHFSTKYELQLELSDLETGEMIGNPLRKEIFKRNDKRNLSSEQKEGDKEKKIKLSFKNEGIKLMFTKDSYTKLKEVMYGERLKYVFNFEERNHKALTKATFKIFARIKNCKTGEQSEIALGDLQEISESDFYDFKFDFKDNTVNSMLNVPSCENSLFKCEYFLKFTVGMKESCLNCCKKRKKKSFEILKSITVKSKQQLEKKTMNSLASVDKVAYEYGLDLHVKFIDNKDRINIILE